MTNDIAKKVAEWISGIKDFKYERVKPVLLAIAMKSETVTFFGASYCRTEVYSPGHTCVINGWKKVGEEEVYEYLYLVGSRPDVLKEKKRVAGSLFEQKNVLTRVLVDDDRDWYVSGYYESTKNEHHPFGHNFILSPWNHVSLGRRIDAEESVRRNRIPFTIQRLGD